MTYRVKLKNAKTGWVIEDVDVDSLGEALRLQNSWFRDFHTAEWPEYGLKPLVNLAVTVSIGRHPRISYDERDGHAAARFDGWARDHE